MRPLGLVLALALLAALWVPLAQAASAPGTLERVSLSAGGAERNKLPTGSTTGCSGLTVGKCAKRTVSDDGNAVVFASRAPNLISSDNNNASDIFLWRRDATAGTTTVTRISEASGGGDANGDSETPTISPNGQWVAFESKATNLVTGDSNSSADVFVWSQETALILASQSNSGAQGNLQSFAPSVADNGTVAFTSFANNLTSATSPFQNVFVRKTPNASPSTDIVSVGPADAPGGGPSKEPSIDAAGTKVAFTSAANNIGDGTEDANGEDDVFVRDLTARSTKRLTADLKAFQPAMRADGNQVAYAAELGDSDIRKDIFVVSASGGNPQLVSGCSGCSDITDRPAVVPSIANDGKVAFQSAARYDASVRSDQVWVTSGPVAASRAGSGGVDGDLADNIAELASISGNGNFVVFTSAATNLVPGDFNGSEDVFMKDMGTKAVTRISQRADGTEASGFASAPNHAPAISADGSVVAFSSDSSNLVDGDSNGVNDIFVRAGGTTTRISVGAGGAQANGGSINPGMSADGRWVVFESVASNLAADNNGMPDVFLHDRSTGETRGITSPVGQAFPAQNPSISANGRFIAFESRGVFTTILATNLSVYRYDTSTGQFTMASSAQPAAGKQPKGAGRPSWDASVADDGSVAFISRDRDLTGTAEVPPYDRADDVFVQRQAGGPVVKVTVNNNGETADGDSFDPVISADGIKVAFSTLATNMPIPGGDANPDYDVYLRDLGANRTLLASVGMGGVAPGGPSVNPSINRDGSLVAYASRAENLVEGDSNVVQDIFLANPYTGAVTRLSTRPGQEPSAGQGNLDSYMPAMSADGLVVAFMSSANNLVDGDVNDAFDTFVRRLTEAPQCGAGCVPGPGGGGSLPGGGGGTAGYRFVASDGGIFSFGDAKFQGSTGGDKLNKPIVGMAGTPSNNGYWLVASDGGIFSFGDAKFFGSTGAVKLNSPIVGMAAHPSGEGYWFVAADGGIFSFGGAKFHGSTGGVPLFKPIVGMSATPTGNGYWLVASDGGIFSFGDAKFFGSTGGQKLNKPIVGMDRTASGNGYRFVASDGGIFTFGDANFFGSTGDVKLNMPIVGMAKSRTGDGYWLVASDGGIFSFGDAAFYGSTGAVKLNQPIVGMQS
jgi:Tol biopolymer transport system component